MKSSKKTCTSTFKGKGASIERTEAPHTHTRTHGERGANSLLTPAGDRHAASMAVLERKVASIAEGLGESATKE